MYKKIMASVQFPNMIPLVGPEVVGVVTLVTHVMLQVIQAQRVRSLSLNLKG